MHLETQNNKFLSDYVIFKERIFYPIKNQIKSNQIKSNQIKSNQIKSNQIRLLGITTT